MCGIAGSFAKATSLGKTDIEKHATRMIDALRHRGPDDGGVWVDSNMQLSLAHRRLSILDLSPAGHQPMISTSSRYVIVFNGEVYNHLELRLCLKDFVWRGHSDTETLLAAFDAWGIKVTLQKIEGMFAFAVWDRDLKELTLVRDRIGEKPLYYGWQKNVFLFGSELKALTAHPGWSAEIDQNALTLFMRYGNVPSPYSIWKGIKKLLPGSMIIIKPNTSKEGILPEPEFYWQAPKLSERKKDIYHEDAIAVDQLDQILRTSIKRQMIADVPIGAFLSGGVDSSTIVAMMQEFSIRPVRTFSIGFTDDDFNEAKYAKVIAEYLGTTHTELYVSPKTMMEVIPNLPRIYDEPFADSSQIATYLVAALARSDVKVALSGDGGDEIFGGYNRYIYGPLLWGQIRHLPVSIRKMAAKILCGTSPAKLDLLGRYLPCRYRVKSLGDKIHKLASILDSNDSEDLYLRLISQQSNHESIVVGGSDLEFWANQKASELMANQSGIALSERMMFQDLIGYLPDDILTKVDRASMSVGLETRIPMLNHRVVEFASQLPLHMKIRNGQNKWVLRQVLHRYLPKEMIERPKQGFGVPLAEWLRGPLRDWAETLLDESRLRNEGHFRPESIRKRWKEHLSGDRNWQYWIWNVLMFQTWRENWKRM